MKKVGIILLPVFAVILEVLPYGAVLIFAGPSADTVKKTYSYFSLMPYGYANFAPLITAILTCVLLVLVIIKTITGKMGEGLWIVSLAAAIVSLGPLLLGFDYYTISGGVITAILLAECMLTKLRTAQK